jgi:hypothetical protein
MNPHTLANWLRRAPAPLPPAVAQTLIRCATVFALATIGQPSLLEVIIQRLAGG